MTRPKKPIRFWIILGVLSVALIGVLSLNSQVTEDTIRVMSLGGRYNQINRHVISTKATDRYISMKWSVLPRSVSFQTNGPKVKVYLLDMSSIDSSIDKVMTYMAASDAIAKGLEPKTETVVNRAVGASDGVFHLPAWPWTWQADYMLIVFADEEAQVIVRVSYGK